MLQTIRDKTTGWIATAIIVLLIIPFAFWGINYYFSGGKEPVVASINGKDIKLTQFQRTYSNYRLQMQNRLGKALGPQDEEFLKQQTLNKMIESELLNQITLSSGLYASNEQVRETIKNIDVFKSEDGFNRDYYQQSIMRLGMTPAQYEQQMRLDMISEQLQSAIIESEFATKYEVENVANLINQKRDLAYTIIPTDRFKDTIEVSDADIQKYYDENTHLYISPEQVKVAYIELNLNKLAQEVKVNEDDLKAYYESNIAKYKSDEQRKVTQILIKVEDENATDAKLAKAKAEAEKILDEIHSGKTIKDITKEYTDNKNTDFSVTEYGYLSKGVLQPEVDEEAFAMQVGDISDVIKSKIGFHIIKLEDVKGGKMNTFTSKRDEVEKDYRKKMAEQRFFDLADQLGNLAYEHPDSLDVAAEETGLSVQETGFFSKNGEKSGTFANPKVISASFSEDVLTNRLNSDLLELSDRDLVVLHVIDHKAQKRRPLEEVREDVIKDVKFAEASKQAHELGQQIISDLRAGKDMSTIAGERGIKWKNAVDINRDDISINRSVLRKAFSIGIPGDNKPVFGGESLGTGDFAVIAVQAIRDPEPGSIKDKEIDKISIQLFSANAGASWQQYLNELKANAKIILHKDKIE